MRRAALLALLLAAAVAARARAQEREPSGLRFARSLSERGWDDLAGLVLDGLASDRAAPKAVREQVAFLRAELLLREAIAASTPDERRAKGEAARRAFEELARSDPVSPAGFEARVRVGEVELAVGDAVLHAERGARRPPPEPHDGAASGGGSAHRSEAEARACFERAGQHFTALAAELELLAQAAGADDGAAWRFAHASLLGARARQRLAACAPPGDARERLLDAAVAGLEAVATDFADVADTAAEASLLAGEVELERGRLDAARAAFGAAVTTLTFVLPEGPVTEPYWAELLGRALLLRLRAECDAADWPAALATVKDFRLRGRDLVRQRDPLAERVEVEEARARHGSGDLAGAKALVERLRSSRSPAVRARAEQVERALGGQAAPADDGLPAVLALLERHQEVQGLARLRALIAELETAGERGDASLVAAWSLAARAYVATQRLDEAGACLELVARRWPKDPRAPRALFDAATCFGRLGAALPNEVDAARVTRALEALRAGYPDAPEARTGARWMAGSLALARREYSEAAARFAEVPEEAGERFDAALLQVGVAWSLEARARKDGAAAKEAHEHAVAAFDRAIGWYGRPGVDPASERAAGGRRLLLESWLRLAGLHLGALAPDPARAVAAARRAEELAPPGSAALAEAVGHAVQGRLAAGDLAAAEAALVRLEEAAPEARRTAEAARDVAAALDAASAQDPALRARAADGYARWLERSAKNGHPVTRLQAARAGDRLFRLALLLNDLPETTLSFAEVADPAALPARARFEQAATAYALAAGQELAPGEPRPAASEATAPWLVQVKLGECLGLLGRHEGCVQAIDRALALERLVDAQGNIVTAVAKVRPALLLAYADAAQAARLRGDHARAIAGFRRLVVVCPVDGALWWRSKYELLLALTRSGDHASAGVGLRSLERTYPGFDRDRFGYRARLEALAAEVKTKRP